MRAFSPVLGIPGSRAAWDVYLIYGPDARWDGDAPPTLVYWMHRLGGVTIAPELDPEVFGQHLAQTLAAIPR